MSMALFGCFAAVFATEQIIVMSGGYERRLTDLHNAHRVSTGVPHLILDDGLSSFAENHAKVIAKSKKLIHSDLEFGGQYRGENLAMTTHPDETLVMKSWLRSRLHRNNLESSFYTRIGIGRYKSTDGYYYWCVVFNGS